MRPTEICLREACKVENWRSKVMRLPLPKELVRLAWKARVGYSFDKSLTHCAYRKLGQLYETLLRDVL